MTEIILAVHLLVVLFFLVGFPLGLLRNHRLFRIFHAGALGGVTLLMVLGIPCPLTVLEESLREQSYEGSFLAVWLNRVLYLEWFDPFNVLMADLAFAALVFSSFWWYPLTHKK
ncbi:hypothetical protein UZ36_00680 [Candidatus Nitromaritima sp. SCGC AAA799-C22]|nr:hypothetical protein UZ36_00680 [Candidatus Nitromaritima sp. SCGC AAA799-C22]